MSRPEHRAPPDIFYDETEAKKYAANSRMIEIQTRMTERAIELLNLPAGQQSYILDIGCGSGLSGEVLSTKGYNWVGMDISAPMLGVAVEREVEGDLVCTDMGEGVHFRPGTFDGAISISALQWLCNADNSSQVPQRRLKTLFQTLYSSLTRGARAVFQFYPETPDQMAMITQAAMRCGFSGGIVVDFPNSKKAKKIFLCLFAGEARSSSAPAPLPKGKADNELTKGDEDDDDMGGGDEGDEGDEAGPAEEEKPQQQTVLFSKPEKSSRSRKGKKGTRKGVKNRDWVLQKKERQRKQGKQVRADTKYTGRSRGPKF